MKAPLVKDQHFIYTSRSEGNQVFKLYKRFHADTAGKGVGLFVLKSQVEKPCGTIAISSQVNKGTAFNIEF